jgi:hypothetical protein
MDLPSHYDKFLARYAGLLKIGGFLVTDNFYVHFIEQQREPFLAEEFRVSQSSDMYSIYGYSDPDQVLWAEKTSRFRRVRTKETDFILSEFNKQVVQTFNTKTYTRIGNFVIGGGNGNHFWGWYPQARESYPKDIPRDNEHALYGVWLEIRQKLDNVNIRKSEVITPGETASLTVAQDAQLRSLDINASRRSL